MQILTFGIKSITHDGVTEEIASAETRVLRPSAAYVVTETLAEAVDRGTATRVRAMGYRGPAAGKTGSSHDAWFAGYTPRLLAVVWVGFDDYHNLGMVGGDAAAPIWTDFIKRALALRPDLRADTFTPPAGAERMETDHQPAQIRLAGQNRYSTPPGATRRRPVRRTRPTPYSAPASREPFQPMTNQYQLAPQLMPQTIRRQVQPMIRQVQPMIRQVQPMIRR